MSHVHVKVELLLVLLQQVMVIVCRSDGTTWVSSLLPCVLAMVDWSMIVVDWRETLVDLVIRVVGVVVRQVWSVQNGVLVVVHRLHIVLVIILVVQLWVVPCMLSIVVCAVRQHPLFTVVVVVLNLGCRASVAVIRVIVSGCSHDALFRAVVLVSVVMVSSWSCVVMRELVVIVVGWLMDCPYRSFVGDYWLSVMVLQWLEHNLTMVLRRYDSSAIIISCVTVSIPKISMVTVHSDPAIFSLRQDLCRSHMMSHLAHVESVVVDHWLEIVSVSVVEGLNLMVHRLQVSCLVMLRVQMQVGLQLIVLVAVVLLLVVMIEGVITVCVGMLAFDPSSDLILRVGHLVDPVVNIV